MVLYVCTLACGTCCPTPTPTDTLQRGTTHSSDTDLAFLGCRGDLFQQLIQAAAQTQP
jgi:hypothetical protein